MYYIVNKTVGVTARVEDGWPSDIIDMLLKAKQSIIVISTYSNTIKTFTGQLDHYGEWDCAEFELPSNMIVGDGDPLPF